MFTIRVAYAGQPWSFLMLGAERSVRIKHVSAVACTVPDTLHLHDTIAIPGLEMKRSGSNRVARKIGSYDDDEPSAESANNPQNQVQKPAG